MSIAKKWFYFCAFVSAQVLVLTFVGFAQDFEAKIEVSESSSATIEIKGNFLKDNNLSQSKNLVFLRSFAGSENLGERVSDLKLLDKKNQQIAHKKFIEGEYLAESEMESWSYQINITPSEKFTAKAHVSWLDDEKGILMLRDLLPQFQTKDGQKISARIKLELPKDWKIITIEKSSGQNTFDVADLEKAVFLIGKGWRENKTLFDNSELNIATFGDWRFSDSESVEMTKRHFRKLCKGFWRNSK